MLAVVELHTGVLSHAATRRLDQKGWRVDGRVAEGEGSLDLAAVAINPPRNVLLETDRRIAASVAATKSNPRRRFCRRRIFATMCANGQLFFLGVFPTYIITYILYTYILISPIDYTRK